MRPRVDEVLASVAETFDEYVAPEVEEPYAKSMAEVISGLLRQLRLRVLYEGDALYDDIAEARTVLTSILGFIDSSNRAVAGAANQRAEIRRALSISYRTEGEYPTLTSLSDEAADLEGVLDGASRWLLGARDEFGDDHRYADARAAIRAHAAAHLAREAQWVAGAPVRPGL